MQEYLISLNRDITTSGLNNAISLQGGVEYLRNMDISGIKRGQIYFPGH